ncbi:MAG: hypothetical protein ACE5QF_01790 [Thermoplasmata archaeon]
MAFRGSRTGKERIPALVILALVVVQILLIGGVSSFSGGAGDGKFSYGGCVCHTGEPRRGSGIVEIWASTLTPEPNEEVTVIVNVTEDLLSSQLIIGVFLLKSMTGSDSDQPSTDGWRIVTDPNGATNNYVKKTSPGEGSTVSFEWLLLAPFSGGTYNLTARVHHGGNSDPWFEEAEALTFVVTGLPQEATNMTLVAPAEVQRDESFTISARLTDMEGDPLVGFEVIFFRMTTYGKLQIGSNATDNDGYAYHLDSASERGIFEVEAYFEGTSLLESSNATAEIGILAPEEDQPLLIGGAPLEIVAVVISVVLGVWLTFAYVLYQLHRISKAGKEESSRGRP